jgi:hypothetical protein
MIGSWVPDSPTTPGVAMIVIAQETFLSVGENLNESINEDNTASSVIREKIRNRSIKKHHEA